MLPVEAKVEDSAWFPLVMTDAALFHALICTSALLVNSTSISNSGSEGSLIQRKHMLESIRLINARLPGDEGTSDATITTILFMAKAEASPQFKCLVLSQLNFCYSICKEIIMLGVSIWMA